MSLQLALLIIVSSAAAALAATKYYGFARADLERLRQQEYWTGRFRDGCRAMISDPRLPEADFRALGGLNGIILDPAACLEVYASYYKRVASGSRPGMDEDEDLPPLYDDDFAQIAGNTYLSGLMAITYANLKWGEKTRGLMAHHYGNGREAANFATRAVKEVSQKAHSLPPDLVAA